MVVTKFILNAKEIEFDAVAKVPSVLASLVGWPDVTYTPLINPLNLNPSIPPSPPPPHTHHSSTPRPP